jgi:uncharacterized protein
MNCRSIVIFLIITLSYQVNASPIEFENFTPLTKSTSGGALPESNPLLLSSPNFTQITISENDRGPLNGGMKLGDSWDMITLNENGPQAGQYLFNPYEIRNAGVKRLDLTTMQSVTIVPEGTLGFIYGDSALWTPWGTFLTTEESWGGSTNGRIFEITNPLADPSSINFVTRSIIPRVAHEGITFDKDNTLYFSDENSNGSIYKYVSRTPTNGVTFFDAGQSFVLKVNTGSNFETTGAATWVAITDMDGVALPGIPTLASDNTSIDGRAAADVIGATGFNRPEDMQIQKLANGEQYIYFATTGSDKLFSLNISNPSNPYVNIFVDKSTIDVATGLSVGNAMRNPDNLAIDNNGNIYFQEDIGDIGLEGFDIWFSYDVNRDGIAESIGRWASLSTIGSEGTGLYFNPFDSNIAYLNVQHSNSDIDRTIQITAHATSIPEPGTLSLFASGLLSLVCYRKLKNGRNYSLLA